MLNHKFWAAARQVHTVGTPGAKYPFIKITEHISLFLPIVNERYLMSTAMVFLKAATLFSSPFQIIYTAYVNFE